MRSYMHPVTYAGGDGHPLVAFSTHPLKPTR